MMGTGYVTKKRMSHSRDDGFYRRCVGWDLAFAWLPKRCDLTGRRIWLKEAWRGTGVRGGGDSIVFEERWHDPDEHLVFLLGGNR